MEKIFRKTDFICRAAIMLLLLVTSATAWAQTSASYRAYNTSSHAFETLTANSCTAVTSGTTTMSNGWYVVNSNVTVSTRITVNGTVNLILADGYSLTASQGITVNSGNTLNIYGQTSGTGALNATGVKLGGDGTEAAGIGSTGYSAVGSITIHGGRITATGADWSAGIGGGVHGGVGSVTIYDGTTLATAGDPNYGYQDAIGSGSEGSNVTKTLADGLRVTTYNNTTPVAYGNRVSNLQEKKVTVEPCTSHNLSNNVCTYCGLTIYTVTYNSNNATSGTVPASYTEYQPGETVTILGNTGNLVRTGYTYSGWNTAANGSGTDYVAGTSFAINNSLTLYAKWTPIEYTITCDLDGGTVATANPTTYTAESDAITLTNPTRDGYVFAGWTGTGLTEPTKTVTIPAGSTGNRTYTATWAEIFTITYDLDGGTVATANPTTYTALSDNITLNNPTRDGYVFTGWTGTDLTEPTMTVTIPKGSTGDRSYTATWIGITGSYLAYNTTTGGFEMRMAPDNIASVTSSTTTMGADNTVTWYIVDNIVSVSDRITVNGTVHLILCDGTTLTASKGITVNSGNTLNIYGQTAGTGALNTTGTGSNGSESAAIGGTGNSTVGSITIHGGRITANGASWSAGIGGGLYGGGGSVAIYGGTVNATGHDGTSEAIGHGSSTETAVAKDLIDGLRVTTNNNSTPVAYGDRKSSLSQKVARVEPCKEHNLSNNVCTYCGLSYYGVTYNGNNATGGTVPADATEYELGQTVTVLGNTGDLVRTGYTFIGWNTQADGLGTDYAADATFTISSSVTLYAKWTPITYTITYDLAGGTVATANPTSYNVESAAITLNNPTRDGYIFAGWTGTDISGTATTVTIAHGSTGDREYTATWTPITYTIAYDLDGGTADNPTSYTVESNAITLVNPTKDGYNFTGWTGTDLNEPAMTVTIPAGSTGNREYTATWTAIQLTLANNDENGNNSNVLAQYNGVTAYSVTLSDRTIFTDGDWNTLCLPFDVDDFTDTPLQGATVKTLESSSFSNGTLTMTFSDNLTSIEAGKPYIVKWAPDFVISSEDDWNTFATNVTNGTESYEGKVVQLAADITVSTMAGDKTNLRAFKGVFEGNGHTLNLNISTTETYPAPFRMITGAIIRNLRLTGTIYQENSSTAGFASGLVGLSNEKASYIANIESSVNITSDYNGKYYTENGGIVANCRTGSAHLDNCLFNGKLLKTESSNSHGNGGIIGRVTSCSSTIRNTLYAPTEVTMLANKSKTFCFNLLSGGTVDITNSYYTNSDWGTDQGIDGTSMSQADLASALGYGWKMRDGQAVPKMEGIENPVFSGVTISDATANVSTQYVDFVGTYAPVTYSVENRSVLFLGGGSKLYYPDGTKSTTINACRAFFTLNGITAGDPANGGNVKGFVLNFDGEDDPDGLNEELRMKNEEFATAKGWYSLDGKKLDGKPTQRGIYIHNGKKVLY